MWGAMTPWSCSGPEIRLDYSEARLLPSNYASVHGSFLKKKKIVRQGSSDFELTV